MKLSLPTRMATAVGALLAAAGVGLQETHWSHPLKQALTGVLVAVAAWVVHPTENTTTTSPEI